jgi:hypothetical protein
VVAHQGWSAAYLAGVALVMFALVAFVSRDPDRHVRRLGLLGAGWPLVLMAPLLGLRGVDLYRGGLMLALAAGWLVAVIAHRLHERHPLLPSAAMAMLALALAPRTADSAAAWGPQGFYRTMTQAANRDMAGWLAALPPHCRERFWAQVARDAHMEPRD